MNKITEVEAEEISVDLENQEKCQAIPDKTYKSMWNFIIGFVLMIVGGIDSAIGFFSKEKLFSCSIFWFGVVCFMIGAIVTSKALGAREFPALEHQRYPEKKPRDKKEA